MIKLFNVYFPTRTLVLFLCEGALISGSFLLAVLYLLGPESYIGLVYRHGIVKIVIITLITLLLSYYFNLYEPQLIPERFEAYFRLLLVPALCHVSLLASSFSFRMLRLAIMSLPLAFSIFQLFSSSGDKPKSG